MNLDKAYVYILVRKDLPRSQQVVQSCHAVFEVARELGKGGDHPSMVVCGVNNEEQLKRALDKLSRLGVKMKGFYEPLFGNELTALASEPLSGDKRLIFKNYQLLKGE